MHIINRLFAGILLIIFSFCCTYLYAQQKPVEYATQWKKVDTLISKGLTKSALAEVNKIYKMSKNSNNDVQVIKALLYKLTLQQNIEENASVKSIDSLEIEINSAKEPARSILESITAQLYWNYFQQNRYNLYQRTNTTNFTKTDIATWTADDLNKKIGELYVSSLENEKLLQQTNLADFNAILIKGNTHTLRPTLYDLLAHRALDYFKSDERDITKPAYAFEIKDSKAFASASDFMSYKFITKDSSSLHHKALLIFQNLLQFHIADDNPNALIDADIERINFVNQYGVMENKDSLFINALQKINQQFSETPAASQAGFLAAQSVYNIALQKNKQQNAAKKYTVLQAKELLDVISKKFPDSEGGINARNLINQITHPSINLTTEKVNVPGLPFLTLVTYKNFSTVYFRVVKLTPQLKKQLTKNYDDDNVFQKITSLKSLESWRQDLPQTNDYLSHSAEVKIDALPVGEYALLGSAAEDFSLNKNPLAVQYFYISDISFINSGLQYFILNRTTGQPLKDARVQVWNQEYDNKNGGYKLIKSESLIADKNGYLQLQKDSDNNNRNVRLDINYKKDHLFMDDAQYVYNYNNEDEDNDDDDDYTNQKDYDKYNSKVFLFTDRSIYRPGQLVYFKGISVTKDWKTRKNRLLETKDSLIVFLKDANNQNADSVKVVLNDFGSFNGTFRLPENKLNGEFNIEVDDYENSSVSFSVEEYKRPKFYTEFDTLKEGYRVGDTVSISGFAKAYAGNNIDGAKVSYRVTRVARFLYPWIFWKTIMPQQQPLEITHGEIITGADGKFVIQFAAIPDLSIDKNTDPVFDYKVEADVTDINGETRSGNITVPVGYKSLDLQINLTEGNIINIDSLTSIKISSKNLSGQPVTVNAIVKIYKLQPPQRLIRQRLWEQPDTFTLSKDEFINYFPHDEYKDETKKESWLKDTLVFQKTDTISLNYQLSTLNLSDRQAGSQLQQGWYVIEATAKDKYGEDVKDVKYIQLYDDKSNTIPSPAYIWNYQKENLLEPGETAHIVSGTSAKNVFLIQEIDKSKSTDYRQQTSDKGQTRFDFISLSNNEKISDFKILEDDRGGFGVNYLFVKDNRFYFSANGIYVPWSNKDLNISFDTYRDKTLPGSEEKWKVKISGNEGQKVAAEMLASMYDASLDQFKPHSWSTPDIWPTYSGYNSWMGNQSFSSVQSFEKYWNEKYIEQKEKNYDAINYLPQNNYLQGRVSGIQIRGTSSIAYERNAAPSSALNDVVVTGYSTKKKDLTGAVSFAPPKVVKDENKNIEQNKIDQSQIQIRKNFNETAFFYPDLRTDKDGNIEFSFTMPEALTQWKLMTLVHTKDLASSYATKTIVTQKDLMVQPNAPRFLREGDRMEFTAKIANLTNEEVSGQAELQLLNASTMNPVDGWFKNINPQQHFTASANQSTVVKFNIEIPANFNDAVVYRIVAKVSPLGGVLEGVSDGEEVAIPVVTNRMLVTETMPLPMRGNGTKDFKFEKLINSASSSTLNSYGLTVEYTTNPAWYAVQALPYLMEYPYECAEQTFNRYYANAIATKIVNSSPKIKEVFEKWKTNRYRCT